MLKFKLILIAFIILVLPGCRNDKSKSKISSVQPLCNQKLFIERYEVSRGGAYDGDIISAYLTDSTSFRKFLLSYDNAHERVGIACKGIDSIFVTKMEDTINPRGTKILSTKVFSLLELREMKIFE